MDKTYIYNNVQMLFLLDDFQYECNKGKYTKSIPYNTWRQIKICREVNIRVVGSLCVIYDHSDIAEIKKLYTDKIYEFGFGRFFYDTVIKKEQEENMRYEYKSNADTSYSDSTLTGKVDTSQTNANKTNISPDAITYADGITFNSNTGELSYTIDTKTNWWNGLADIASTSATTPYATKDELERTQKEIAEYFKNGFKKDLKNDNKENEKMKGFNFDFGPCGTTVRMSIYGLAVKNISDEWVSYNPTTNEIFNVDIFNISDGGKYIYKMPVAISDVAVGDMIIHNRTPVFVTAVNENGTFDVMDVRAGENKNIISTKSPFGFNFVTKVVSLFDMSGMNTASAENPFGNMWMLAMMSDSANFDIKDMMMLNMMSGNGDMSGFNPMMLMLMADGKNDTSNLAMMMMLMNNSNHICKCGQK